MFRSRKATPMAAVAAVLVLGGWSSPAWATYGGGLCHRCAPPAVIDEPVQRRGPRPAGRDRLPDRL